MQPAALSFRAVAMLEILYATGLRVSELVHLQVSQFRRQPDFILVVGKGGRERLVPLGLAAKRAAADWLELRDASPDTSCLITCFRAFQPPQMVPP